MSHFVARLDGCLGGPIQRTGGLIYIHNAGCPPVRGSGRLSGMPCPAAVRVCARHGVCSNERKSQAAGALGTCFSGLLSKTLFRDVAAGRRHAFVHFPLASSRLGQGAALLPSRHAGRAACRSSGLFPGGARPGPLRRGQDPARGRFRGRPWPRPRARRARRVSGECARR